MGAVVLLTPVVVAAWPAFAAAVASAAAALGYAGADSLLHEDSQTSGTKSTVIELDVPNSEIVTGQLGRDQKITVTRDGIAITFRRDAWGKAALSVSGSGCSREELQATGEEMSRRVVRDYVYQQIMNEIRSRDYMVVDESVDEHNAIRMTVRHWEN